MPPLKDESVAIGEAPILAATPEPIAGQVALDALAAAGSLLLKRELQDERVATPDAGAKDARQKAVLGESEKIQQQYGVRPRNYRRAFDAPRTDAQLQFQKLVPEVTRFINAQLAAAGSKLKLTEAELATNFLSEGGILLLELDQTEQIDGFQAAGIDTIIDRYSSLKRYLHPSVRTVCEDPKHRVSQTNEQKQTVTSITDITLGQATYANAGMYAAMARTLEIDFKAKGIDLSSLPAEARVFWTTMYFNGGEGLGRKMLAQHGVDWYKTPWTKKDDLSQLMSAKFNSTLRTANFALMNRDLDGPTLGGTDGISLPTAPVATVNVPVTEIIAQAQALLPQVQAVCAGKLPFTGDELDELIALLDTALRAHTLGPKTRNGLENWRNMAWNAVGLRVNLRTYLSGGGVTTALYAAIHKPVPPWAEMSFERLRKDLPLMMPAITDPSLKSLVDSFKLDLQNMEALAKDATQQDVKTALLVPGDVPPKSESGA